MDRAGKAEAIKTLEGVIADSGSVIVARYTGLTVAEMTQFRGMLREQGATAKVVKNRLFKKALDGKGGDAANALFADQTVIAYAEDPVASAKAASEFAKENEKLVLLGGAMGSTILDQAGVNSLAALPSLDELRGKLVGLFQAPAGNVARVLNAPGGQLARVMGAKAASE